MHARCVREDTKQALKGNLQADGVQNTWLLMLRYHFVSTFDNELCNLWRQCVPGGLLLIWYYSAGWGGCQGGSNKLFDYYIRESMVKNCICNI